MPSKSMPIRSTKSGKKNSSECLYKLCILFSDRNYLFLCLISMKRKIFTTKTNQITNRKIDTKTCRHYNDWYDNNFDDEWYKSISSNSHTANAKYTLNFICCYLKNQMYAYTDTSFGRKRTHRYLEEEVEEKTRNNNNCTNENVAKRARISTRLHL